jgi:hypothetical protein
MNLPDGLPSTSFEDFMVMRMDDIREVALWLDLGDLEPDEFAPAMFVRWGEVMVVIVPTKLDRAVHLELRCFLSGAAMPGGPIGVLAEALA